MKTKGLLSVVLLLIVLNLLSVLPAAASDELRCPSHAPLIASLRECVAHAHPMGHITNQGILKSLLAKLDAAQAAVDRGQSEAAVAQLEAFIHEVEAQAGKHIDTHHAEPMITHAREVINKL